MKNKSFVIEPSSICMHDYTLYFFDKTYNVLGKKNLENNEVTILGSIPDELFNFSYLVGKLVYWDESVILIPLRAKKMWIFHENSYSWTSIDLDNQNSNYKFSDVWVENNKLILFGFNDDMRILCFDLITKSYSVIFSDVESAWGRSIGITDNALYVVSKKRKMILEIKRSDFSWKIIETALGNREYVGIAWDGKTFWLAPNGGGFLEKWNLGEEPYQTDIYIRNACQIVACDKFSYVASYTPCDEVWVVDEGFKVGAIDCGFVQISYIGEEYIYWISHNGEIIIYDRLREKYDTYTIEITEDLFWKYAKRVADFTEKEMFSEPIIEDRFGLERLIGYVTK